MSTQTQPKIAASLSLHPTTHSFSSSSAPLLDLTLVLEHDEPITIYEEDQSPWLMLACGAFTIHNLSTGAEVTQYTRTNCRFIPPSWTKVDLDEGRLHTLSPHIPYTISTPFTRKRGEGGKPLPAGHPQYLNHSSAKPDRSCGVDGLDPGNDYTLALAAQQTRVRWYSIRWWEVGSKEDLLRADGGLDARKVMYGKAPHPPIEMDTSRIEPIVFRCEE